MIDNDCLVRVALQPLDYETQREHVLLLTVENVNPLSGRAPKLQPSTATVVVTVMNKNEGPYFREDPIVIKAPESLLPGATLTSVPAFDPDNSVLR